MTKNQQKATGKLKGYSILTAFLATFLIAILSVALVGQLENFFSANVLVNVLGLGIAGFVIDTIAIAISRYKPRVYLCLGTYLFILIVVLIIFGALGYYLSNA